MKKKERNYSPGVTEDKPTDIDIDSSLYPFSIVWTPLPLISYILPFLSIGHVGICTSEGLIHDFAGSQYINVGKMTFDNPYKFVQIHKKLPIDEKE